MTVRLPGRLARLMQVTFVGACGALAAVPLFGAPHDDPRSITIMPEGLRDRCMMLATNPPGDVRIVSARVADAGTGWSDEAQDVFGRTPIAMRAPFCRIQGVIEKEIGFELWLPLDSGWNQKFLAAGVGGDAGSFNLRQVAESVNRGYAAATTDTGHKSTEVSWMLGDPQRLPNFELRANHLLAVKAKELIRTFYGKPVTHAYFSGCSGGGRQGLKEMQRFPEDYDGIIAGAPGPSAPEMTTRRMWEITMRDSRPGLMSPADWKLISDAGVARCDLRDGIKDGVAENPRLCHFKVAELQCKAGKTANCLTVEQVAFASRFYAPMRDRDGRKIDDGILPGVLIDSGRSQLAVGSFGRAVRKRNDWNGDGFDVRDDLAALRKVMPELAADDPNVAPFRNRGGKLIIYQGWMDWAVAAKMTIGYYDKLMKVAGPAATARFSRLYMMPGVFHCALGPGPDQINGSGGENPNFDAKHDVLTALEDWVERGRAPADLIASKVEKGRVVRTRKLCPYPQQAHYRGNGSTDDAANFVCGRAT